MNGVDTLRDRPTVRQGPRTFEHYVPDFRVRIKGKDLPAFVKGSVTSITHQTGLEGADRVEMTLADDGLRWIDNPIFATDLPFDLELGYQPNGMHEVFFGEITGINASFGAGMPTVTVVAHDRLQRLTSGSKKRAFQISLGGIGKFPIPDDLIAIGVPLENLLVPVPDPIGAVVSFLKLLVAYLTDPVDARRAIRIQDGESDFEFLSKIAKQNGWEMTIDHGLPPKGRALRFRFLFQDYTPDVRLDWGRSLLTFEPKISLVGENIGVSMRIWVASIKVEFVIVLSWDFDRQAFDLKVFPGFGSVVELLGDALAQKTVSVEPVGPAAVPQKLLSELLPKLNSRITCSGSTIGDPRLTPGTVIDVKRVGEQFGGPYRITSTTHSFGPDGFTSSFEARKEIWFRPYPVPRSARGLFRIQGETIQ
jgi:uncharacterized protein